MASGGLRWLRSLFSGASSELGAHDLRRHIIDAIKALVERDSAGNEVLPGAILLTITAPTERLELVQRFVREPSFDADITAALLNELYGINSQGLPAWSFHFVVGELAVVAAPTQSAPIGWLAVIDGDRRGVVASVLPLKRPFTLGRTHNHGDGAVKNDLVVSDDARFVSRRAAALHRTGSQLWLESRDQGDALWLERSTGERLRPTHTVERRVHLMPGDTLVFSDGRDARVSVRFSTGEPGA